MRCIITDIIDRKILFLVGAGDVLGAEQADEGESIERTPVKIPEGRKELSQAKPRQEKRATYHTIVYESLPEPKQ